MHGAFLLPRPLLLLPLLRPLLLLPLPWPLLLLPFPWHCCCFPFHDHCCCFPFHDYCCCFSFHKYYSFFIIDASVPDWTNAIISKMTSGTNSSTIVSPWTIYLVVIVNWTCACHPLAIFWWAGTSVCGRLFFMVSRWPVASVTSWNCCWT